MRRSADAARGALALSCAFLLLISTLRVRVAVAQGDPGGPDPDVVEDVVVFTEAQGDKYVISVGIVATSAGSSGQSGSGSPPADDPDAPPSPPPDDSPPPEPPMHTEYLTIGGRDCVIHYRGNNGLFLRVCEYPAAGRRGGSLPHELYVYTDSASPYVFTQIIWIPETYELPNLSLEYAGLIGTDEFNASTEVVRTVPLPVITLEANPSLGMVQIPSWWWVRGYDGREFGRTANVMLLSTQRVVSVRVRIRGQEYSWDFGDGTGAVLGSLGRAYPAESGVTHNYAFSSINHSAGFLTKLTATYGGTYTVDARAEGALEDIEQSYEDRHEVREAQAILTSP